MKLKASIILIGAAVALAGCNEADKSQQTKSVSWYLEHRDELAIALNVCGDNPGDFANAPNCINANEARNKLTIQEMEDALK
ncbi:EexN family lipoprotein [Bradyrhizobium sp. RT4b]|uniref:EexN family lipoprotein n=1 Tax=unclassified Bradyrhizobium TaxID=2631580 RepID=UPI003393C377